MIAARAVVIAAGGLGQAFGTTSNPAGATGDGIAIAARAGAVLRDLEFVQFHPTVLWLPGASGQCPLITEALRGAGAVLRDLDGTPLMAGHDPRGDLAPRDVVAARMAEVIAAGDAGHVWLDATGLGADVLENGFPTVTAACRKHGIDPVTAVIPVAPGAHYSCGGILADLDGRTTLARALRGRRGRVDRGAGREQARLQLGHRGDHRRAPRRGGDRGRRGAGWLRGASGSRAARSAGSGRRRADRGGAWRSARPPAGRYRADVVRGSAARGGTLAQAMSRWAGVMRDADGLARCSGDRGAGGLGRRPGDRVGAIGRHAVWILSLRRSRRRTCGRCRC